jgi:cardiolipin synthase (CMP-forming)
LKHVSNILTFIRLLLVPLFPAAFFSSHPQGKFIALGIFVTAGVTDFLDGYIARRFNMISPLGTVLDPLADKLMLLTVLFTLWLNESIPGWIFVLLLLKESFMISAGTYLYFKKGRFTIPSNLFGKSATALLFLAIPIKILLPDNPLSLYLILSALCLMVPALLIYIRVYYRHQRS